MHSPPEAPSAAPTDDYKQRAGNYGAGDVPWWGSKTAWRPRTRYDPEQDTENMRGWDPEPEDDTCQVGNLSPCGVWQLTAHRAGLLGDGWGPS